MIGWFQICYSLFWINWGWRFQIWLHIKICIQG